MVYKLYDEQDIQSIADAIRTKKSTTDTYKLSDMAAAIESISSGTVDLASACTLTITNDSSYYVSLYYYSIGTNRGMITRSDNGVLLDTISANSTRTVEVPTHLIKFAPPGGQLSVYMYGDLKNCFQMNSGSDTWVLILSDSASLTVGCVGGGAD